MQRSWGGPCGCVAWFGVPTEGFWSEEGGSHGVNILGRKRDRNDAGASWLALATLWGARGPVQLCGGQGIWED